MPKHHLEMYEKLSREVVLIDLEEMMGRATIKMLEKKEGLIQQIRFHKKILIQKGVIKEKMR